MSTARMYIQYLCGATARSGNECVRNIVNERKGEEELMNIPGIFMPGPRSSRSTRVSLLYRFEHVPAGESIVSQNGFLLWGSLCEFSVVTRQSKRHNTNYKHCFVLTQRLSDRASSSDARTPPHLFLASHHSTTVCVTRCKARDRCATRTAPLSQA